MCVYAVYTTTSSNNNPLQYNCKPKKLHSKCQKYTSYIIYNLGLIPTSTKRSGTDAKPMMHLTAYRLFIIDLLEMADGSMPT